MNSPTRAEQFASDSQAQLAWMFLNGCITEETYNKEAARVRNAVEFYHQNLSREK